MAAPLVSVTVPDGRSIPESLNVTVPVAADGVTVAVKVTELPKVDGLESDKILVVVD